MAETATGPKFTAVAPETSAAAGNDSNNLAAIVVPVFVLLCTALRIWKHMKYKIVCIPRDPEDHVINLPSLLGSHVWHKGRGQQSGSGPSSSTAARSSTTTWPDGRTATRKGSNSADCVLSIPTTTERSNTTGSTTFGGGGGGVSAWGVGVGREQKRSSAYHRGSWAIGMPQSLAHIAALETRPANLASAASFNWRQTTGSRAYLRTMPHYSVKQKCICHCLTMPCQLQGCVSNVASLTCATKFETCCFTYNIQ